MYVALLQFPCAPATCIYGFRLTPAQAGVLKGIGLSPSAYAAYYVAFTLVILLVCLVTSTLIIWRRSDDRMALLVALLLVTNGAITVTTAVPAGPSPWQVPNDYLTLLFLALFLLVSLLFPSGQFVLTLSLPFSFGFAMLHSRLWDIDILINRTLVYGALTLILTTVYVGLVIGLQTLLRGFISQDNSISIVISTLAIARSSSPCAPASSG